MISTQAVSVFDKKHLSRLKKSISTPSDYAAVQTQLRDLYRSQKDTQYQPRDWENCDYDVHRVAHIDYAVRGPVVDELQSGRYFVVLGSATSFGTCVNKNYAHRLSRKLGMPCINLSHSGASPEFYVRNHLDGVRRYMDKAAFVIIETMSSRSVSNSRFVSVAGRGVAKDLQADPQIQTRTIKLYHQLLQQGALEEMQRLIGESLDNHVEYFCRLIQGCPSPIILLWLSKRKPEAFDRRCVTDIGPGALKKKLKIHPHFGDRILLEQLGENVDTLVECSTRAGIPSQAINRFTGQPGRWYNRQQTQTFYPSPEMHLKAFRKLLPAVAQLLPTRK